MYAVTMVKPDGSYKTVEQPKKPDLPDLQRMVDGDIQEVPHLTKFEFDGVKYSRGIAYCNEEGRGKYPRNDMASELWVKALGKAPLRYAPILFGTVVFIARVKK